MCYPEEEAGLRYRTVAKARRWHRAAALKGKALCVTRADITPDELHVLLALETRASLTWELLHLLSKLPSSPGFFSQ